MEEEFWEGLSALAQTRGQSVASLIAEIDEARDGNLSSALRLAVLRHYQNKADGE